MGQTFLRFSSRSVLIIPAIYKLQEGARNETYANVYCIPESLAPA